MNIRTKLVLLLFGLSAGIVVAAGIFFSLTIENYFRHRVEAELHTQADQIEFLLDGTVHAGVNPEEFLYGYIHTANIRFTLIDSVGRVVFDSDVPVDSLRYLENHLHRPEVQDAIRQGSGTSSRHSATVGVDMLYFAKMLRRPFAGGNYRQAMVLRVAMPLLVVDAAMKGIRSKVMLTSAIVLLIVIGVTGYISTRIAGPIREMASIARQIRSGALDRRIPVHGSDEFGQLAVTLNSMVDRLNDDIGKLKKLEEIRSQFLGNVSHELRTPLFTLQGMLETLLDGAIDDPEVNRDFVSRALANTKRLDSLLKDLIEISRIESGEMKMSFRYFPINDFLEQIVAEMVPAAEQKGLSLGFEPGTESIDVYGDRMWLKHAIGNIIDNAIKYTPQGSILITTQLDGEKNQSSITGAPGGVIIRVSDTGIGIPAEHLPRIFERFYRVDRERSREAGGTGLGLAIVKHIIEAHNSTVHVSSSPGEGSTFSISLSR